MAHNKSTTKKTYTPVSRKNAKVGDIRRVSKSGGSRSYWTSRQLGKKTPVGGGASDALRSLSIDLATGSEVTGNVTEDLFDKSGKRTGKTRSAKGRTYSRKAGGGSVDTAAIRAAEEAAYVSSQKAIDAEVNANNVLLQGGSSGFTTAQSTSPYADGSFSAPQVNEERFQNNQSWFSKLFNSKGTRGQGRRGQGNRGNSVDGNAAVQGGPSTWGDGGGQYTPGISSDGLALTATRNQGVPSPTPTSKPQATAAGVEDTGGQSAANASGPSGENSGLRNSLKALTDALSNLDINALMGTADGVDNAIAGIDDALTASHTAALADMPDYDKAKDKAEELYQLKADAIEARQDVLEARYNTDKAEIKADFAGQKEDLTESQKGQTGSFASGLANAGAYLGFDNVNHAAMLSLEVTQNREMTVLGQGKIAALNEARRAFEDADFALLTEKINAIEAYDKKITELANTNFNQTLQLTQESRANIKFMQDTDTYERAKADDNLDKIIEGGGTLNEGELIRYAKKYNISPDQALSFIEARVATQTLQKKQTKTAGELAIIDRLSSIDKGTFVTIDGVRREGLRTPTAAKATNGQTAGNIAAGTNNLTEKMVFEKYGNDPLAMQFVGQPVNALFDFFGQSTLPDTARPYVEETVEMSGKGSTDPTIREGQIQDTWMRQRNGILGQPMRADVAAMPEGELQNAITQINRDLFTTAGDDSRAKLITREDVFNNPNEYTREFLDQKNLDFTYADLKKEQDIKYSVNNDLNPFNNIEEEK